MRKTLLSNTLAAPTKVLVVGMAYECKDGSWAALAWDNDDVMGIRIKTYHADRDGARNACKTQAVVLLGERPFKPAYVNRGRRYTINLWS